MRWRGSFSRASLAASDTHAIVVYFIELKEDPQLKRGEMKLYSDKKHELTKQVVGAVPGT